MGTGFSRRALLARGGTGAAALLGGSALGGLALPASAAPTADTPTDGDLAVIGTRFGQAGTPGWYHNLRARPDAEVRYQGRSVDAVAREAEGEEWQAVWDRARTIYGGYEAYARRITDRKVHIMVLSPRPAVP